MHEYTLAYEEENDLSQYSGLLHELRQEEPREEDAAPVKVSPL